MARVDYMVCGVRKGDLLVYDKSATAERARGLVVVVRTGGEMQAANFLAYEPAPADASPANNGARIKKGEICTSEWDGKRIRFIKINPGGKAYPVTHVVVRNVSDGGGRPQVVALDLGLDCPDESLVCKILLDSARVFSALRLESELAQSVG